MFYIQPEINYLPKGAIGTLKNSANQADYAFNYYEIPINVLAKFDAGVFRPFLFAGPSLSFLPKATLKYEPYYPNETNISRFFEITDFSINFGTGIELTLSNSIDLVIMVKYYLGLTDIAIDKYREFKTQGITIAAGIKFGI
jgi:hypothetical protein